MKLSVNRCGSAKVRRTISDTIPERMGNMRSFLSSIRMFQLVFTSAKLLPILSNIGSIGGTFHMMKVMSPGLKER
jgi:hypothetical protein